MELGKRIEKMTELLEDVLETINHIEQQISLYLLSMLLKEKIVEPISPEDYE